MRLNEFCVNAECAIQILGCPVNIICMSVHLVLVNC